MTSVFKEVSDNSATNDTDTDRLVSLHAQRLIRPVSSRTHNKFEEPLAAAPAILYECTADLTVTTVSANSAELIGVRSEKLIGNRTLWDERLAVEDRQGLLARIDRLSPGEVLSETHRLIDERGLPVWVSHSLCKIRTNTDTVIRGCMIPLPTDFSSKGLDSGVISQFVHKIGNHFQLINLLIGSFKRGVKSINEIETLQETVDRAVEFTRAFLHYSQAPTGPSEVDLGEVLRAVIHSNAALFVEKKVMCKDLVEESLNVAEIEF